MALILTRDNLFIIGALLLITFHAIRIFNRLIQGRVRTQEAWAGIAAQLKRRMDLVPALVSAMKGYTPHEVLLLEEAAHRGDALAKSLGPAAAGQARPGSGRRPGGSRGPGRELSPSQGV